MNIKSTILSISLLFTTASVFASADMSHGLIAFEHGRYEIAREILLEKKAKTAKEYLALGEIYDKGLGVPENPHKAVKWYLRAAEQGDIDAQNQLGHLFQSGKLGSKNYQEAAGWYRKAAEQKNADAELQLGLMYREGRGVEKSLGKSQKWMRRAAEHGSEQARKVQAQFKKTAR